MRLEIYPTADKHIQVPVKAFAILDDAERFRSSLSTIFEGEIDA